MLLEMVVLTEAQRLHPGWKKIGWCAGSRALPRYPPARTTHPPFDPQGKTSKM